MGRLGDQHAVRHADDAAGLTQDDLDLARVTVELGGELDGLRARVHSGEVDDRAFGLGDDLLGHDEDVVLAERDGARCSFERVADQAPEIVAKADLGDPVEGEDDDRGDVGRGCGVSRHRGAPGRPIR